MKPLAPFKQYEAEFAEALVLLQGVILIAVIGLWPETTITWLYGFDLGWLYLLTLKAQGLLPIGAQLAISMTRMVVFGVWIVLVGQGNILKTLIVICGCFSYKLILLGWLMAILFKENPRRLPPKPPQASVL